MKAFFLSILVSITSFSSVFAHSSPVSSGEAASVIQSLNRPENLTARMLKSSLNVAKSQGMVINPSLIKVEKLSDSEARYSVSFYLNMKNQEETESARVNISEVLIQDGKAYVFGFSVERAIPVQNWPGVSLGNN